MELTAENVQTLLKSCFYEDGADTSNAIFVEGLIAKFGFDPIKIAKHKPDIASLLLQLPAEFCCGYTFLNGCMTRGSDQWGEQRDADALFALGQAAGFVTLCFPRSMWYALPGGVPYLLIDEAACRGAA